MVRGDDGGDLSDPVSALQAGRRANLRDNRLPSPRASLALCVTLCSFLFFSVVCAFLPTCSYLILFTSPEELREREGRGGREEDDGSARLCAPPVFHFGSADPIIRSSHINFNAHLQR